MTFSSLCHIIVTKSMFIYETFCLEAKKNVISRQFRKTAFSYFGIIFTLE